MAFVSLELDVDVDVDAEVFGVGSNGDDPN